MNIDTEAHLDLEDLLAGAAREPLGEQARDHLGSCPDCRTELARWGTVAGGTQLLVAATDVPPWRFPAGRAGSRGRQRALLTSAAAAAVLAAAGGTTWALTSGGATPAAALTAVTGCPGLAITSGTLEQIDGARLVVRTSTGQDATVTTAGSTTVRSEVPGSLSDITNGSQILAHIVPRGRTMSVKSVLVNLTPRLPPTSPPAGGMKVAARPGQLLVLGRGEVTGVHPGGFTVVRLGGHQIQLTTSAATKVDKLVTSSMGQLRTGAHVIAVGKPSSDGTLVASAIEQGAHLPSIEVPLSSPAGGGCDPSAVASTLALRS